MDIASLKGKTLDDKLHGELLAHVADLVDQKTSARTESIDGRKKLKADLAAAQARLAEVEDYAGIDAGADISTLPALKGNTDAVKQADAKRKRAEDALAEKNTAFEELAGRHSADRRARLITDAVAKHGFVDDTAQALIERGIVQEGDEFFFKGADGKQMPLPDAAAHIAATRPHLVRMSGGQGGSGFKGGQGGGVNPWAKATFNLTEQMQMRRSNPSLADQFKAAAAQAAQ